ncbi:MAG: SBBP repeat-containing protein [Polyangiaceae bacterium]|nr:SBBP repeat-containing protein [Polyangiaceae bacterium]
MRTRKNHRSVANRSSLGLMKKIGAMTGIVSACAAFLAGACGDAQPTNTTGAGGAGTSSSGDGGTGLEDFTTSSNTGSVSSSSSSSSSSSGAVPSCPTGDPTGGPTKVAAAFGDASVQTGAAVAFDKSGNILLAGSFAGSINLGGTTLNSAGMDDVFVAKFTPAGQLLWAKQFGDGQLQTASGIGADSNGNVYVTGSFKGSINFGGGALNANGNLFVDIFLAKLTSDGNHVWSQRYGDENVQNARGLSVDSAGNVIIVGSFQNSVNFGGANHTSAGAQDAFAAKYNSAGVYQWSRQFGDAADQYARAVWLDAMGNVYLAGDVAGSIDFGGGAMTATSKTSAFVAKLDSLGVAAWAKLSTGDAEGSAKANAVAVGPNGEVIVGGNFRGTFDLGGMPVTNPGTDDAFVTVLTAAGAHTFTKTFGDSESQTAMGVAMAPNGDVFVAGNFSGSIDFDTGMPTMSAGAFDGYVARLNSKGCPVWLRTYPGPGVQLTQAMAIDPTTGGVAVTGSFNGTADFGTGVLTAAGDDVFLLSVNP